MLHLLALLTAPTFRCNPWGTMLGKALGSHSEMILWDKVQRKPKSRVLGLMGLGQAAGADMRTLVSG